jgi:hypothetical protein
VPTKNRCNKIAEGEEVESAAQDATGDTVEHRGDPGYLRLVDSKMWGDRTEFALGHEDLILVCRDMLGGDLSMMRGQLCPLELTAVRPEPIQCVISLSFLIRIAHLLWRKCVFVATAAGEAKRANAVVGLCAATVEG